MDMVDFQERDTRRSLRENGEGDDGSDGEAEIDQVRQQLEERPTEIEDDRASDDGEGETEHAAAPAPDPHAHSDGEAATHDHHHHHDIESLGVAVVTVSSSRTLADDPSGDHIVEAMVEAGHDVVTRELIPDDYDDVQHTLDTLAGRGDVDVVVSTGGTGVTPDDCTIEAARPLFEKELPGFGELFRRRSESEIGTRVMATRATAGVVDEVPVFCLPGSRNAVELGVEDLIVEEAPHIAGLAGRDAAGHQQDGHDHGEADHRSEEGSGQDGTAGATDAHDHPGDAPSPTGDGSASTAGAGRSDGGTPPGDDDGDDFDPL